ncbi:YkgJ family cysteine cluster protein [Desulfovibrio sp. OttesenSCG-928-G15]|nr:YkgJ family cysteine cluster protein [Desulfovibrio sp. OttesenSCG-928-G15]
MSKDATKEFLQSLPEVKPGEQFWFDCHPDVPCFNACCSGLTMPLTPYDVLRLATGLSMSSEEFIEDYAVPGCYEDTGFPLLHLRMEPPPARSCPFLTPQGCSVYAHRSSACRTYPLGRATRPADEASGQGIIEQYFLVREEHCRGFEQKRSWTIDTWLSDQGIADYNRMNDRYMQLMARYKSVAGGALLSDRHATMLLLCLYQQDRFLELINNTALFTRVVFTGEYQNQDRAKVENSIVTDAQSRLWFAFSWAELVLFGQSDNISPALP